MFPRLSPVAAHLSPSPPRIAKGMPSSNAGSFRMRQALSDLTNSVVSGRNSILRFSVRSHAEAYPRLMANGGRFSLPDDRDLYADVLLAAAMPEEDFPAFTTATAILLLDLLQNGEGTDALFWNWDSFETHYRLADPQIRASIMNGFRLGFEMGTVKPETPPSSADCLTLSQDKVAEMLINTAPQDVARAVSSDASAGQAGLLWAREGADSGPSALAGFRYLYERPISLTPPNPMTAPLIRWS